MKIRNFLAISLMSIALANCGTESSDTASSDLKTNPVTVNRYNATGGPGFNGAMTTEIATVSGTSLSFYSQFTRRGGGGFPRTTPGCIVSGPVIPMIGIPAAGVSHADGRVLMNVSAGAVLVELTSENGSVVHDSRRIAAPFNGEVVLNGPVFSQPLQGLGIRICNPTSAQGLLVGDEAQPPQIFEFTTSIRVDEIQYVIN